MEAYSCVGDSLRDHGVMLYDGLSSARFDIVLGSQ